MFTPFYLCLCLAPPFNKEGLGEILVSLPFLLFKMDNSIMPPLSGGLNVDIYSTF